MDFVLSRALRPNRGTRGPFFPRRRWRRSSVGLGGRTSIGGLSRSPGAGTAPARFGFAAVSSTVTSPAGGLPTRPRPSRIGCCWSGAATGGRQRARRARMSTPGTCGNSSTPVPPVAARASQSRSGRTHWRSPPLTAPGFGPVHTTRTDRSGGPARCRPAHGTPRLCKHGRPTWCTTIHTEDDPRLGQPICSDCYDYPAHVAFNWHAPELWRRFTIALRRTLAHQAGLTAAEFGRRCRVSFVKVAEFQRRGVVHFHALIRLDGPGTDYEPPHLSVDATGLTEAIRQAAAHVRLTVEMPDGSGLVLRFGKQIDTQTVNSGPTGQLTPEHAARYIAKYATKSAEDFGLGDRRISPETLPLLNVTDHVDRLVRLAWQLGEHDAYDGLRRWVHMIGFRGHFASKSRRYSTTLGAIRGERRAYRQRQTAEHVRELPPDEQDTTLVVARWEFAGVGYLTAGDTTLALSAAARARDQRQAARDAA